MARSGSYTTTNIAFVRFVVYTVLHDSCFHNCACSPCKTLWLRNFKCRFASCYVALIFPLEGHIQSKNRGFSDRSKYSNDSIKPSLSNKPPPLG